MYLRLVSDEFVIFLPNAAPSEFVGHKGIEAYNAFTLPTIRALLTMKVRLPASLR